MLNTWARAIIYFVLYAGIPIIIPSLYPVANAAEDDVGKAIVEKADRIRFPQLGCQVNVRITTTGPGREAEVREYEILSKGNDRTIVRTLAPASDKGQVLLMRDRDLWVFMPNISQPIRLSARASLPIGRDSDH